GTVYLAEGAWRRLPPSLRFARPPRDARARDYEYTRLIYWPHIDDARAGHRYAGFHVEVLERRGTLAHLVIYAPGSSLEAGARGSSAWIDLADVEQCDAGPGCLSTVTADGDRARKSGSLYLALGVGAGPKLPPYTGLAVSPKLPPFVGEG